MNIKTLTPKQSLNKAYRKATVFREEFDTFRKNLSTLFDNIDHEEREDNHKIHLKNFLDDNYYKGKHLINSKNSTDLVIYLVNKQSSNAGVMLEVKRPTNKSEMITLDNINRKAFHELVLYYLQERIERKNDEIKYLIATNIYEWFIFDAVLFENLFYKNRKLIEDYTKWKDDQKVSGSTEHFYNEIVKPFLDDLTIEILFTYFNLENYKKLIHKTDDATEEKFIPLYKILSPVHLLKQPFANDSNSLDRNFYHELLHIIGLEEEKDKNKKVINRKDTGDRDPGSFIENAIQILKVDCALDRIREPEKFGSNKEDQLYHIALELSLTWINRILFLKLLESQLFNYHKNDDYKFLNIKTITDFDELYKLFHSVLAIRINDRVDKIKTKYAKVPYLNSSLFEITELENQAIRINQLDDSHSIKIYKSSKLDKKKNEKLNTLQYLFEFLDAYNFTSEGKEKIEEEKKSLINASVLGLIFEKINGYKDGSYFTPGFITMYMCRETIRRAVIQKFNEKYNWNCETFDDLKNHLAGKKNTKDIIEANEVVNSIKICDPAVGSGHFLVSALNEIITIKAELGILADDKGVILSGYEVRIENDELIITYNYGEDIFEYHLSKSSKDKANESQRVQEILFTQKQTIIENCLFGVDINPNSIKIAQLRLWIELLKNAYYTNKSGYTELETLPNIDINIKEGNSLVSKFDIHHDIFPSGSRKIFDVYKINVGLYKNEHNRDKRKELKKSIESTKERIRGFAVDPLKKENEIVDKLTEELHKLNTVGLFDRDMTDEEKEKSERKRNVISDKLNKAIEQRKSKAEEYKALYANAFEWRFEFPEVLDEDGNFVGFDVVIGNPPYGIAIGKEELKYYKGVFQSVEYQANSYVLFIELALKILHTNGVLDFILPATFTYQYYFQKIRKLIASYSIVRIRKYTFEVFKDADIGDSVSISIRKKIIKGNGINFILSSSFFDFNKFRFSDANELLNIDGTFNLSQQKLDYEKIYKDSLMLGDIADLIVGIKPYQVGKGKPVQTREIVDKKIFNSQQKKDTPYKKCIVGKDFHRYVFLNKNNFYLKYGPWLAEPREQAPFNTEKIILRQTADSLIAHLDTTKSVNLNNVYNIGNVSKQFSLRYILALLNSKLMNLIYQSIAQEKGRLFAEVKKVYLKRLPIKQLKHSEQKKFVSIVDKIIKQKKDNPKADTTKLESEIDQMVYKLYGLTEEEIRVVEGS